ncbi:MAG TPA: RNA-binding domain-containing protein [Candidatus Babeliales bacterium]|nr:RNA-binding domain-containing protein [Candidatus Babeliales bacterium]
MKIAQLKTLIKHGESEQLEFKTSTANLSSGMQTVCAFLNSTVGGTLIFGVKDNGQIIGQEVTDKTRKELAVELSKLEPIAKIEFKYIKVADNRQVIVLLISPGEKAPYSYDGRAFTRNQSTTMRMSKEEYIYLYNLNNPVLWESLTSHKCKLSDLDRTKIQEIVRMSVFEKRLPESALSANISDILKKLELITDHKLTNAAVILFCKNNTKQFRQSTLKLARFRGVDKTTFLDTKMFKGNAFDLYDKAMEFLNFNLPVTAHIVPGKSKRVEEPAIPYNVLREAITNALVHRDYSHAGGSMEIAIYDDRVNISNIGALPKGVLLSSLSKEHLSIQRNPLIAHIFYLCGKIEKWGRGTIDMIQDCKKAGNPLPQYAEIGGSFSVTLRLKTPMPTIIYTQSTEISFDKLTDRQKLIIKNLQLAPLSRQQLMTKLPIKLTDRTMQLELTKLKNLGLIKPEGKTKAIIWSLIN